MLISEGQNIHIDAWYNKDEHGRTDSIFLIINKYGNRIELLLTNKELDDYISFLKEVLGKATA